MLTIIEDCSPYYIRFTYDGLTEFIEYANNLYSQFDWEKSSPEFNHLRLDVNLGKEISKRTLLPLVSSLRMEKAGFFYTPPGHSHPAHKDGLTYRFGINFMLKVLDDKCITSWYDDGLESLYQVKGTLNEPRTLVGFDKTKHTPLKTMVAKPNECVLFNTDIYHAWDNSNSLNERVVLALRCADPHKINFDNVKQSLLKGYL